MRWLLRTRIGRAKELLERTDLPVDQVAHQSGFRSVATFRHHFGQYTETTPQRYRSAFYGRSGPRRKHDLLSGCAPRSLGFRG
jgi:transcriptional regulator GlxA family with amidase domain